MTDDSAGAVPVTYDQSMLAMGMHRGDNSKTNTAQVIDHKLEYKLEQC